MQNITSAQNTASALTDRGIEALRGGDRERAYTLLHRAVQVDPQCERAWLWLSGTVSSMRQRRECLERVLAINPQNEAARRGLEQLPATLGGPRIIGEESRPAPAPAQPAPAPTPELPVNDFERYHSDEITIPETNPHIHAPEPGVPPPPAPPVPEPSRRNPLIQRLPRGSEVERAAREIRTPAGNSDAMVAQLRALAGVSADLRARQPESVPVALFGQQVDSDAPTVIATAMDHLEDASHAASIQIPANFTMANPKSQVHQLGTALIGLVSTLMLASLLFVLLFNLAPRL